MKIGNADNYTLHLTNNTATCNTKCQTRFKKHDIGWVFWHEKRGTSLDKTIWICDTLSALQCIVLWILYLQWNASAAVQHDFTKVHSDLVEIQGCWGRCDQKHTSIDLIHNKIWWCRCSFVCLYGSTWCNVSDRFRLCAIMCMCTPLHLIDEVIICCCANNFPIYSKALA